MLLLWDVIWDYQVVIRHFKVTSPCTEYSPRASGQSERGSPTQLLHCSWQVLLHNIFQQSMELASSKNKSINSRINIWNNKMKQKENLNCMQWKIMVDKIKQLEDNCITLRKKNCKSENKINRIKSKKNIKQNQQQQALLQCLQRKRELVS